MPSKNNRRVFLKNTGILAFGVHAIPGIALVQAPVLDRPSADSQTKFCSGGATDALIDESLREVAFPLGGIGTGSVSIEGRGAFRDWEIFNSPNKGSILPCTFPVVWAKEEGEEPQCRVLHGRRDKNFTGDTPGVHDYGGGHMRHQGDGMPCFTSVKFNGRFPMAQITYEQPDFPLAISLKAFNPFIPLDTEASSMPAACLVYRIENKTARTTEATIAFNIWNAADGWGFGEPNNHESKAHTIFRKGANCHGLWMNSERWSEADRRFGTMALTTDWQDVTYLPQWLRAGALNQYGAFDPFHHFWNQFSATGKLNSDTGPKDRGPSTCGTLGLRAKLAPGQSEELVILISWCFPNLPHNWGKNYYAKKWPNAWAAAEDFFRNRKSLTARTEAFERAFYDSTLPPEALEAAGSNASILHSPTCMRLEDGTFWAWEGCGLNSGCCHGSCTHVWNYSLTPSYLFPDLHRTMREAEYKYQFDSGEEGKKGAIVFRLDLPLGTPLKLYHAAIDGQLGGIIQLHRDWRFSGDDEYLKSMWPSARRALEYAWVHWDSNKEGFIDGDAQHNTYDINFKGPNPLSQFFYLAALKAGEKMAAYLGEKENSALYRQLYEQGKKKTERILFNGEYFVQTLDVLASDAPKYQHGKGCLSDQLFGQFCATVAGLGYLVDSKMVKSALKAVFKYNFRDPLGDHANMQRIYALSDESGLLLCSWPLGGRPTYPFIYSDEIWTGIEYQVASHLIFEGMIDEGLKIVRAVRQRYNGLRRNPYNEFECGSHYARAMASWGLVLSLSGFDYAAVNKTLHLRSRWSKDGLIRSFFSTNSAWGVFEYGQKHLNITPMEGELIINRIVTDTGCLEVPAAKRRISPQTPLHAGIPA
jgi:uncharacterized protein (DUF608 family)